MADYHSTHTGNIIDAAISAVIAGQAGIQGVKVNGVELTPDLSNKVDVSIPEAGIAGVKVNGVELEKDDEDKVDVPVPSLLNSTGQSTTAGMTQKAITDAIGSSTSGIAGVKVNGVELEKDAANKVDVPVPNLLTSTGQSTTAGMTQKAITDELSSKADSSGLSQVATSGSYDDLSDKPTIPTLLSTTGQSTTDGMTQKAITDAIGSSTSGIAGVKVNGVELEKDAANKVDVPVPVMQSSTGSSTSDGMTQAAITTALGGKVDTTSIVQATGTSTTSVMSQNAVSEELDLKVDKETGKGLSTNDYTTTEKTKLSGIEAEANKTTVVQTTGESTTSVMSQKAVTDAIGSSTSGIAGVKVNGVELEKDAANKVDVPVPSLLTSTGQSTTAGMTQKAITDALSNKADSSSLSQVATSGSYDDLSDKPTIPTLLSTTGQSTTSGMTQKSITDALSSKADSSGLSQVATSGSYDDLSDKPTIPTLLSTTGQSTTAGMTQKAITDAIGSSTSGIAGVKVNGVELTKDSANKVDVPVPVLESTTGSSTTAGMTQNAITTALADKINTSSVVQSTGTSTTNIMSQKAVTDELSSKADSSGLSQVATSGSYDDLSDKPTIPTLLSTTGQSTTSGMTQKSITDALSSKADSSGLSQVATSGSYDDLSDKPTIPTLLSTTGQSTTDGMTQKAITDAIGSVSGIAGVKVNGVELTPDQYNKVDVPVPSLLTSKGQSTTAGMTQKAITDELNKKSELRTYYVVPDKDNWVGQSAPYTQVFDMSSYSIIGDVFFADLGSQITVDSLEDWSCISSIDITNSIVTLTCLEDKPKDDLVVYLRCFTD